MTRKIVGAFRKEQEATRAIEELKRQGFSTEEISVVAKDRGESSSIQNETDTKAPEGLASGAATGGVLGGVTGLLAGIGALAIPGIGPIIAAGPIAATLTGAAVGAGAGGLVGGLIGLGIPEDRAKEYGDYVNEGNILVIVDADNNEVGQVYGIFRNNQALNDNDYREAGSFNGTGSALDPTSEAAAASEDAVPDPNVYHGYGRGHGGAVSPDMEEENTRRRR